MKGRSTIGVSALVAGLALLISCSGEPVQPNALSSPRAPQVSPSPPDVIEPTPVVPQVPTSEGSARPSQEPQASAGDRRTLQDGPLPRQDTVSLIALDRSGAGVVVGYRDGALKVLATEAFDERFRDITPRLERSDLIGVDVVQPTAKSIRLALISVQTVDTLVLRSENLGESWLRSNEAPDVDFSPDAQLHIDFPDDDSGYLTQILPTGQRILWRTTNSTNTWLEIDDDLPLRAPVQVNPTSGDLWQVAGAGRPLLYVYTSALTGWGAEVSIVSSASRASQLTFAGRRAAIASLDADGRLVVHLRRKAASWANIEVPGVAESQERSAADGEPPLELSTPTPTTWWLLEGRTVHTTSDAGRTFRSRELPGVISQQPARLIAIDARNAWLLTRQGVTGALWATTNAGRSWVQLDAFAA